MDRKQQYERLAKEARDLFSRKNKEYGDSIVYGGVYGAIIEFIGIAGRLQNLIDNFETLSPRSRNRAFRDSFLDLVNYSIIGLMMLEEQNFSGITRKNPGETIIYALQNPDDGEIRYIGKSDDPERRLKHHLTDKGYNYRTNWLKQLRDAGKFPYMLVLRSVPIDLWKDAERWWIEKARQAGFKLTNNTVGGDGSSSKDYSLSSRERMSLAKKGKHSWRRGMQLSEEQVNKMRSAMLQLWKDADFRNRLVEAHKGKPWTAKQRLGHAQSLKIRKKGNHWKIKDTSRMKIAQIERRKREKQNGKN